METIFETHPYLYVLLDPKNPWKNEGFYTPNKREKHPKNEGNVGSYGVAWINHWNSQRFTGAGAIYLSRHGISTLPVLMAWCGDGLKKTRCFFDTSRVCTKLVGYNFIILYWESWNTRYERYATFCLSIKKRSWSKLLQSVCLEMFQVWVHQEHRRPVFCFGGKYGCHEAGLKTDTPSVIPKSTSNELTRGLQHF